MNRFYGAFAVLLLVASAAGAMKIDWVRTTGQFPVEAAPTLFERDHKQCLLAVNRKGQVMLWNLDGTNCGGGADGLVAELPQGFWSSSPVVTETRDGFQAVVCNDAGTVVALDREFRIVWQYALPGGSVYSMAKPALIQLPQGSAWVLADKSGAVTCLDTQGKVVWQTKLDRGECATGTVACAAPGDASLMVTAGSQLCRLNKEGALVWSIDLGKKITLRPEIIPIKSGSMVVCGTESGDVCAVGPDGQLRWRAVLGEELSGIAVFTPSLLVVRGLWGNLHAVDMEGRIAWTHLFAGKGRCCPVVLDADHDGTLEALVTGYQQHARTYDHVGNLKDDIRLNGSINGSPLLIKDAHGRPQGAIVTTVSLLAYYLKSGAPVSPYGTTGTPKDVVVSYPRTTDSTVNSGVVVENPNGALLRMNLTTQKDQDTRQWVRGVLTARSLFEMPIIGSAGETTQTMNVAALDARGRVKQKIEQSFAIVPGVPVTAPTTPGLFVKAVPAYDVAFDANVVNPTATHPMKLENVYQGEVEAGSFLIGSTLPSACRARLETIAPVTSEGKTFAGTISLREAVLVGTLNSERVPDALCDLGDGGLVQLAQGRSAKIWVSVDTAGACPGTYRGKITVTPIQNETPPIEMPLEITVLDLALTRPFPLRLCTWDYVPNKWFPANTEAVIDDMVRHGVNIFPRTGSVPKAKMGEDGRLTFDWSALDVDLKLFKGKGQILFQVSAPPITFSGSPTDAQKHEAGLAYLRQWRDYLKERGWGYDDYAFYPVDEPGFNYGNSVSILLESAAWFREADPKFRIYTDPVPTLSTADFERIRSFIDVWCPNMRLVSGLLSHDARMEWIRDSKKETWSYECVGQVRSLSPLRYNRANAWRGYSFGLQGIGFWTHCTAPIDPWLTAKTLDDEYALVYPGRLPVASARWEAVRDGLEDVAALDLLKKTAAAQAQTLSAKLKQDIATEIRLAERDMLDLSDEAFMESRDFLKQGSRRIWHTDTDVALYARHRATIANLTQAANAPAASK